MLNHTDSALAAAVGAVMAVFMFLAGWTARSLAVSELPICETISIRDGVGNTHSFEVCK